jgi:hypothetical protein
MITVSHSVGRLAEVRMTAPVKAEELATMQLDMNVLLGRVPGRIVICADLSGATVLPPELADLVAKFFRAESSRLERIAVVVGSATFFLQMERLFRLPPPTPGRGSDPMLARRTSERKPFQTAADAITWLDEVLNADERARLRAFFQTPVPRTSIF